MRVLFFSAPMATESSSEEPEADIAADFLAYSHL